MSDDSMVARRELLLGALEKYARQGNLQLFRVGEWILVHRVAEADTIAAAQARMAPADVGRWRAARNAMFRPKIFSGVICPGNVPGLSTSTRLS
jgi:hypothetical protein